MVEFLREAGSATVYRRENGMLRGFASPEELLADPAFRGDVRELPAGALPVQGRSSGIIGDILGKVGITGGGAFQFGNQSLPGNIWLYAVGVLVLVWFVARKR